MNAETASPEPSTSAPLARLREMPEWMRLVLAALVAFLGGSGAVLSTATGVDPAHTQAMREVAAKVDDLRADLKEYRDRAETLASKVATLDAMTTWLKAQIDKCEQRLDGRQRLREELLPHTLMQTTTEAAPCCALY